jgi:D-alanine-D-alanine ligase
MASLGRIVPAPIAAGLTARIQELAIKAFCAIGATGVARVDFLLEAHGAHLYLNEINTMPGSLAFYLWEASGIPFDDLVSRAISIALDRHQLQSTTQFSFEANLLHRK